MPRAQFGAALDELRVEVDAVGARAAAAARAAVTSLVDDDRGLALEVIAGDATVDAAAMVAEAHTQVLIAEQQPVARDLRFLMAALRVVGDYEKVGNRAMALAKSTLADWDREAATLTLLGHMADLALGLLDDSRRAWRGTDLDLASGLAERDAALDGCYRGLIEYLLGLGPAEVGTGDIGAVVLYAHAVGRNLERIADHAVMVGEQVVSMLSVPHGRVASTG